MSKVTVQYGDFSITWAAQRMRMLPSDDDKRPCRSKGVSGVERILQRASKVKLVIAAVRSPSGCCVAAVRVSAESVCVNLYARAGDYRYEPGRLVHHHPSVRASRLQQ